MIEGFELMFPQSAVPEYHVLLNYIFKMSAVIIDGSHRFCLFCTVSTARNSLLKHDIVNLIFLYRHKMFFLLKKKILKVAKKKPFNQY